MRGTTIARLALLAALAPVAASGDDAAGTLADPQPTGWQVPAGERGAAPNAPIAVPPPVDADDEDRPKIRLESLERDGDESD